MIYFIIGFLSSLFIHFEIFMDNKKYPFVWFDFLLVTIIITIIWPYLIYVSVKHSYDQRNRGQISMRGLLLLLSIIIGGIIGGGAIFYWIGNIIFRNWY